MLAKGNGTPIQCVQNLLSIIRGEVPFERVKGLDARLIDQSHIEAKDSLIEDAKWLIATYEPRVNAEDIMIVATESEGGDFELNVHIQNTE